MKTVEATGRKTLIKAGVWTSVCVAFPALDARLAGYKVYAVIPKFRHDLRAILAPKAYDAWINPASPAAEVEPLLAVRLEVGLGQGPR